MPYVQNAILNQSNLSYFLKCAIAPNANTMNAYTTNAKCVYTHMYYECVYDDDVGDDVDDDVNEH